jgi:hypothetical protein
MHICVRCTITPNPVRHGPAPSHLLASDLFLLLLFPLVGFPVHIVRQLRQSETVPSNKFIQYLLKNNALMSASLAELQAMRAREHARLLGNSYTSKARWVRFRRLGGRGRGGGTWGRGGLLSSPIFMTVVCAHCRRVPLQDLIIPLALFALLTQLGVVPLVVEVPSSLCAGLLVLRQPPARTAPMLALRRVTLWRQPGTTACDRRRARLCFAAVRHHT